MTKIRSRAFLSKIAAVSLLVASFAHPEKSQANPPCEALLCMSGLAGIGGGLPSAACSPSIAAFFAIRIYTVYGYDPIATSIARKSFLLTCQPGAAENLAAVAAIIAAYGAVPFSPI